MSILWSILVFLSCLLVLVSCDTGEDDQMCTFRLSEVPIPEKGLVLGDPRFDKQEMLCGA